MSEEELIRRESPDDLWFSMNALEVSGNTPGSQNADHVAWGAMEVVDHEGTHLAYTGDFVLCMGWRNDDGTDAQLDRYVTLSLDQIHALGKSLIRLAENAKARAIEFQTAVQS